MKKHVLSVLIGFSFAASSVPAYADDLAQVFQLALQNDPTLQRIDAERRATQKGVNIARADWWPQIGFEAGYARSQADRTNFNADGNVFIIDQTSRGWDAGVSLSQTLFNMNVWDETQIAEKRAYQAEVTYLSARQQLMIRVVNAYFTILEREDDLEFAIAEKKAIERQLEQTKQRFSVGLTAITDVHEAQAQFDNAVAREIQAKNAVEIAQESLREITGRYHEDLATLDTESFSPQNPSPQDASKWVQVAEEKNLDLLVQRVAVEIAEQQIDVARNGHLPTASLSASLSTSDGKSESQGTEIN
ncbi:MAG TPA: TolC family protein, partial [Pseudidiomarina sp.]|nr:TolC family protein [Pseudidiomarina sp.]